MKERLYTPTGFLVSLGLIPERMPEPGQMPIFVRGGGRAKEIGEHAVLALGYELTDRREGAFVLGVRDEDAQGKMLISEWIDRYGSMGIESVIRSMESRGVPRQIARLLIAEHLIALNKKGR